MAWKRLQFSLRALMLAVTVCAIACYWIVRPTLIANRCLAAIKSHDYQAVDEQLQTLGTDRQLANIHIELAPLTLGQLMRGERWLSGYLPRGERMEDYDFWFSFRITQTGLEPCFLLH